MAPKLYGPQGEALVTDQSDRISPVVAIDTPEGKFNVPVSVMATFQYNQLVQDIAEAVMKRLMPDTVDGIAEIVYTKDANVVPSSE
jgi:hypothetical protein